MGIRYVDPSIFKVGAAKVSRVSIDISEMRWLATFSLLVFRTVAEVENMLGCPPLI